MTQPALVDPTEPTPETGMPVPPPPAPPLEPEGQTFLRTVHPVDVFSPGQGLPNIDQAGARLSADQAAKITDLARSCGVNLSDQPITA